jgi:hypothetical protein
VTKALHAANVDKNQWAGDNKIRKELALKGLAFG